MNTAEEQLQTSSFWRQYATDTELTLLCKTTKKRQNYSATDRRFLCSLTEASGIKTMENQGINAVNIFVRLYKTVVWDNLREKT